MNNKRTNYYSSTGVHTQLK